MPILPTGSVGQADGEYTRLLTRELPKEAPELCGLALAEFFCCGGGIGLGFRSAGYRLAFANDISAKAAATYGANLGHAPVVRDIREVGPDDYRQHEGVDVLTGGFPCVTFSMAGRRLGVQDDIHGKLYLELCRVIKEIRPRYFVAENVEGILSANGGAAVKIVLREFFRLGYRATYELVNMAEHGVPQTRKRVIFVGVRIDEWRGAFLYPRKTHRLVDDKTSLKWLSPARTLRTAIGDLPAPGKRLIGATGGENGYIIQGEKKGKRISNRPPRKIIGADAPSPVPTKIHPPHVLEVNAHVRNEQKISVPHAMSKRVAHGGRPSLTVVSEAPNVQPFHVVTGELRRMTVRECARVQSFPDWYHFEGGQSEGYKQIGNAVPPLYAKRLAMALLEYNQRKKV